MLVHKSHRHVQQARECQTTTGHTVSILLLVQCGYYLGRLPVCALVDLGLYAGYHSRFHPHESGTLQGQ